MAKKKTKAIRELSSILTSDEKETILLFEEEFDVIIEASVSISLRTSTGKLVREVDIDIHGTQGGFRGRGCCVRVERPRLLRILNNG